MQRVLLAILMDFKTTGIARMKLCEKAIVIGASRKRRRRDFLETNIWTAVAELLAARLVKTYDEIEDSHAGEVGSYSVITMNQRTWHRKVNYVKLTVEGWIVAAQQDLKRIYT